MHAGQSVPVRSTPKLRIARQWSHLTGYKSYRTMPPVAYRSGMRKGSGTIPEHQMSASHGENLQTYTPDDTQLVATVATARAHTPPTLHHFLSLP